MTRLPNCSQTRVNFRHAEIEILPVVLGEMADRVTFSGGIPDGRELPEKVASGVFVTVTPKISQIWSIAANAPFGRQYETESRD